MTENPVQRFGLTKRGRIKKLYYADIVVFDPDRIIDTDTYDDPRQYPVGNPFVLVNGLGIFNGPPSFNSSAHSPYSVYF